MGIFLQIQSNKHLKVTATMKFFGLLLAFPALTLAGFDFPSQSESMKMFKNADSNSKAVSDGAADTLMAKYSTPHQWYDFHKEVKENAKEWGVSRYELREMKKCIRACEKKTTESQKALVRAYTNGKLDIFPVACHPCMPDALKGQMQQNSRWYGAATNLGFQALNGIGGYMNWW